MIHQVSKLKDANRILPYVMVLQIAVLEAAAQEHITPETILDLRVFVPILEDHLNTKRCFRDRSEIIARWIMTGKKDIRKSLVEPLSRFANTPVAERIRFIDAIRDDILLLYHPRDAEFKVAILRNEAGDWKKGARDFLYEFYDLWQTGFPGYIFPRSRQKYARQDFVQEFEKCNPDLFICAVCDGAAYTTKTAGHVYTSVDHFFPRSIYPHLSCHPLNLVPICSCCNSFIKGDNDPMILDDRPLQLIDLILPYQGSDNALRQKAYIAVVKRNPRHPKPEHPMQLELKPARDFDAGNKIAAFNKLYDVNGRWNASLDEIEDHVFRRLTQYLAIIDSANLASDPDALIRLLKTLMAQTDLENMGKDSFAFPMVWLLKSYIDQVENQRENAPILKALTDWAKHNSQRCKLLEVHSEVIKQRVPDD
jgi:hypothetical protein